MLVRDPTIPMLQYSTREVWDSSGAICDCDRGTSTKVMRAQSYAERHLRRLRNREFNGTTGQRLPLLADPKSTR